MSWHINTHTIYIYIYIYREKESKSDIPFACITNTVITMPLLSSLVNPLQHWYTKKWTALSLNFKLCSSSITPILVNDPVYYTAYIAIFTLPCALQYCRQISAHCAPFQNASSSEKIHIAMDKRLWREFNLMPCTVYSWVFNRLSMREHCCHCRLTDSKPIPEAMSTDNSDAICIIRLCFFKREINA